MKYRHSFQVRAPLSAVVDFHAQSASLGAITPPPVMMQFHQAQVYLEDGDVLDFTLWLGPLSIRWLARIENVGLNGFVDRQLYGPFSHWLHHHRFASIDDTTTEVIDQIEAALQKHPFWELIGLGMWLSLPLLFAYRGWKTRRLLEKVFSTRVAEGSIRVDLEETP